MQMPVHAQAFADAAPLRRNRGEHVFDLHPALHIALFGGFFAYLGIMWAAFGEKGLAIPFAIFAIFLAAAFIVPAWWARVAPGEGRKPGWNEFLGEGIVCETGRLDAGGAMVQVLIAPGKAGPCDFALQLLDSNFGSLAAKEVTLTLSLPQRGVEALERKAMRGADGHWVVRNVALPIPGRWHLRIDALITDFKKVTLEDDFELR